MALVIGLNAPKLRILQRCVHKQHTLARKGQLVVCVLLYLAVVDLGLRKAHTNNNEMRQKEVLILISAPIYYKHRRIMMFIKPF